MANLCKFEKEQKYVSYDGGQTWQPLDEYRKGELIERSSPDCGEIGDRYRWTLIDNDYICVGKDTYTKYVYQVSHDGGLYWYNVYPTQYQAGELVEQNSDFCNNATEGHYVITSTTKYDPIWITKCDEGGTVVTENDIRKPNQCLTSITIYDCVIGIGDEAFSGECLTDITIPDNVTSIGSSAFTNCSGLTDVRVGSGVTSIGQYAFYGCARLESINIPTSLTMLNNYTFFGCNSLKNIVIPNSVTSIGSGVFMGCSGLTNIEIPSGVTSIDEYAFMNCSGLTSVTINAATPPTMRYSASAFNNTNNCPIYVPCESLEAYRTALNWNAYASRIHGIPPCSEPDNRFYATYSSGETYLMECYSSTTLTSSDTRPYRYEYRTMTSAVIGDCVTSIGGDAFYSCVSLTSVTIPNSITSIGNNTFKYCTSLTNVTIPNSVISIGVSAFENCYGLTDVTIGSGITSIGGYVLRSCSGLTSITVEATTPPTLGASAFSSTNDCPIYVPCESLEAYRTASNWSDYASRIHGIPPCDEPTPPTNIKFSATYSGGQTYSKECDSSTSLTSGETKPSGYDYSAMASAVIGDCVTSIGSSAFTNCISLSSVTIGSGVTSIGQYAFYECSSLTSFTIPSGVTSISNRTFTECTSLTSVTIPSGVTRIGQYAFYYCSGLTSITVEATTPPTLPRGYYAFHATNDCPIYVPSQSVDAYRTASGWSEYANRIYPIS